MLLIAAAFLFTGTVLGKKKPPANPLNLNTATAEQMAEIPGIGPGTARAIIQFREKSGNFQRVEDLLAIRGITERKLAQIKPYVVVRPGAPGAAARPRINGPQIGVSVVCAEFARTA